jgi:hypothetical protein
MTRSLSDIATGEVRLVAGPHVVFQIEKLLAAATENPW